MRGKLFLFYTLIIASLHSFAAAPVVVSPVNNTLNFPTNCVFKFTHASNETYYDIELDTVSTFNSSSNILRLGSKDYSATSLGTTVRDTIRDMFYDQQYYWRARTRNATDTSEWTTTNTFHTVGAPTITFPLNGDIVNPASFFVYTNHNIGNRVYYMNFDADPSFTYPIYYMTSLDVTTINVVYYQNQNIGIGINPFSNSGTFYMRMRVSNNSDTSDWSPVIGFELQGNIGVPFINNEQIAVYPNPASSQFMLKNISKGDQVSITDITGKIIETRISAGTTEWFDCTSLSAGLYLVKIYRDETHTGTIKLNVTH
jgi:hypothetical protein